MRKPLFLFVGALCLVFFSGLGNNESQFKAVNANVPKSATLEANADYGRMPLYFIPNQGQMDKQVAYYVHGRDKTLYFAADGITFALTKPSPKAGLPSTPGTAGSFLDVREDKIKSQETSLNEEKAGPELGMGGEPERWVVKLEFVGAEKGVKPVGEAETGAVVSYFKGKPEEWQTGLPTYSRIIYPNLWPGIDLVYYGTVNRLKYEFIVQPGADPSKIQLAYRGARKVSVDADGRLNVTTPVGGFDDDVPVAYQEVGGQRVAVSLAYRLKILDKKESLQNLPNKKEETRSSERAQENLPREQSKTQVCVYGFEVGSYDPTQTLVLDPAVLVYCGYIGGSSNEYRLDAGMGIAVDASGSAYVAGITSSTEATFPVAVGPDLTFNGGSSFSNSDAFVAKVNASGTALVYCGYIGGASDEGGQGIAVDAEGNAFVTGWTSSTEATFPVAMGPDLTFNGGDYYGDAFVAKVNAAGTALIYCGYIGGAGNRDVGRGIAVDASGSAYVTGSTNSTETTFPVNVGPDLTYNDTSGEWDAFVAKVNTSGTALVYCGYIGGNESDVGRGIAVDAGGNAYMTGSTSSYQSTFPVTVGPDLTFNGGFYDNDAFVAKVNASGTALVYCGYIGGFSNDGGCGIAVDGGGNAYVTGSTSSNQYTFPVTVGPDLTYNDTSGYWDAFVAKVDALGTALVYCGYIGGSTYETGLGIGVDAGGNAYVTGGTTSTEATFPVTVGPDLTFNGGEYPYGDAFVAKINALGTALVYCGYIGGSGSDAGLGIAVDASGNAYVTGNTPSTEATFPVTVGPDLTFNGGDYPYGEDAFVAKISYSSTTIAQIKLSRSKLNFGSAIGGASTESQDFMISNSGTGTMNWTVSDDAAWLSCTPSSGTGSGEITVSVSTSGLGAGTYAAMITVSSPDAINSPQAVSVALKVYAGGTVSLPFGYFETPVDGTAGIEGSVPVTGWALDDIEVTKVDIWRDPVAGEPVHPNGYVYIGDAVFVEGARPDVEAAYPTYPLNYRAGWGYMMLTNFLPGQGNGTYRIHAIAYDKDGHSIRIGTKTIACDNAHATLPFGAIDTPTQGGTWSGTQVNFGWALTPMPKSIPTDGSTIWLWIDGLPVGHPTYNNYREDIATLFPGFANSNGAVGYYYVDTTQYANGVHTIAWSVEDSAAAASGIGSRYFTVVNTGTGSAAGLGKISSLPISSEGARGGISPHQEVEKVPTDYVRSVHVKRGYDPEALAELIFPDERGVITIETREVDRIEIALSEDAAGVSLTERTRDDKRPALISADERAKTQVQDRGRSAATDKQDYSGYLVVGSQLCPLPTGSTFDSSRGVFSWQPGPGFVGEYSFVFISDAGGGKTKKNIRVRILPAFQLKK